MGWLGFVLVGGGVISVWAGFQGVKITDVVSAVLQGKPVARKLPDGATPGSSNTGSGLEPSGSAPNAGGSAGGGVGGSAGGGV